MPRAAAATTDVLGTCVLLADPGALLRFDDHEVVLAKSVRSPLAELAATSLQRGDALA